MFDLNGIWKSEKKFKIVTGLTISEANIVIAEFEEELAKSRRKNVGSSVGRPPKHDARSIFMMLMIFIRHYNSFEFISVLFDLDVSNVKRWIDDSYKALGEVLVKKNYRHLISVNQEKLSKSDLNDYQKSLLMELSNL